MTETNKTFIFCVTASAVALIAFISQPSALEPDFKNETGTKFFPDFDDPLRSTQLEILEYDESHNSRYPQGCVTTRHFTACRLSNGAR